MRPQHITAENERRERERAALAAASMRPQHITAENEAAPLRTRKRPGRFNEAAAYHCGKPGRNRATPPRSRPGFNEAAAYHCGKRERPAPALPRPGRFNEAAAYHCGKRVPCPSSRTRVCRFNEAAAYHCGKRRNARRSTRAPPASMRPQHITAENEGKMKVITHQIGLQ